VNLQLDHFSDDKTKQLQIKSLFGINDFFRKTKKSYILRRALPFSFSFRNKLSAATKRRHRWVVDCIVENLLWVTRKKDEISAIFQNKKRNFFFLGDSASGTRTEVPKLISSWKNSNYFAKHNFGYVNYNWWKMLGCGYQIGDWNFVRNWGWLLSFSF